MIQCLQSPNWVDQHEAAARLANEIFMEIDEDWLDLPQRVAATLGEPGIAVLAQAILERYDSKVESDKDSWQPIETRFEWSAEGRDFAWRYFQKRRWLAKLKSHLVAFGPDVVPSIIRALPHEDPEVTETLTGALLTFAKHTPPHAQQIAKLLGHESAEVRKDAILLLTMMGAKVLPTLRGVFKETEAFNTMEADGETPLNTQLLARRFRARAAAVRVIEKLHPELRKPPAWLGKLWEREVPSTRNLLEDRRTEEVVNLVRRDPQRILDLRLARVDYDLRVRTRALWGLHELEQQIELDEVESLLKEEEDEAIIGAALLLGEIDGAEATQDLIEVIPKIVERMWEHDYRSAEEGAIEADAPADALTFAEGTDPMIVLWAIILSLARMGTTAIPPIQQGIRNWTIGDSDKEVEIIETINALAWSLLLMGEDGRQALKESKDAPKGEFYLHKECFHERDPGTLARFVLRILAKNKLYQRWAERTIKALEPLAALMQVTEPSKPPKS
jgi:HEAT repeat protein